MKAEHLLTGPPITMTNAQTMRQPQHSERAEAFQNSLQRSGVKLTIVTKNPEEQKEYARKYRQDNKLKLNAQKKAWRDKKAAKAREDYKTMTREEKDKRNANGRKNYKARKG